MLQNFSQTQGTVFHSSACVSSSEGFFKNRSAHFCGKSPSSGACPSQIAILFSLWLKFLMKWKPTYSYGDLNFSDSKQVFVNLFSWRKLEGSLIIFWKFQGRTPQEIWITAIFPARSKVVSYDVLHHSLTAPRRAGTSFGFSFVSFYSASCLSLGDLVQRCLGQPVDVQAPWPSAAVIPRRRLTAVHFQSVERRVQRNLEGLANVRLDPDELPGCRAATLTFFFFFLNASAEERIRREGRQNSPLASQ